MNNLDLNKIYCESNLDTMKRMPDNFVDLVVTSPPYDNLRTYKDDIDKSWGEHVWKPIIKELYRITKKGGVVVWVVNDATINGSESGTSFKQALYAIECGFNLHDTMIYKRISPFPDSVRFHQSFEYMFIWSKGKPNTFNPLFEPKSKNSEYTNKSMKFRSKNGETKSLDEAGIERLMKSNERKNKLMSNIWNISAGYMVGTTDDVWKHPATFPDKLAGQHIYSWSNEGDLVYDPFMGSGTTAKMAHIYKRNWIGSEMSQEYVDLANKRLQPYLTQQTLF
jgi:site-specific DNA-methyltransferase (adenine-specific)